MCEYHDYKPPECASCTLYHQPGPVMGEGDPHGAKLIYIAQNPGGEEVAARPMRPLIGPSGRVFNGQLGEAGIRRSSLFITNQVKCLTPGNREPTAEEVECCRWILSSELERCRADTVLLAGAVAFRENIGDYSTLSPDYHPSTSINERAGCVEQRAGRKWIGTLHPAHIMRLSGTPAKDEAVDHLRKAFSLAGVEIPLPVVITEPTEEDVGRHKRRAEETRIFADDCESLKIGRDVFEEMDDEDKFSDDSWWMDMCGFSAIPYEAIVLPRGRLEEWAPVWANPRLLQCEHNGESDRFHLAQIAPQRNIRFDTMLAHHMLHNNVYKYLKPQCVSYYTNLPYYNRDIEAAVGRKFYCGMDNIATLLIAFEQMRSMKADVYVDIHGLEGVAGGRFPGRLFDLYFGRAFPGEPALGKILPLLEEQRRVGFRIDKRKAILIWRFLQAQRSKLQSDIASLIGENFNWRSYGPGGDVQSLFYTRWGLPVQYKRHKETNSRRVTCDKKAREHLRDWIRIGGAARRRQYAEADQYFDMVERLARYTGLGDYISRVDPADGRVHALQKAHGTKYLRIATVPNVQNWPDWSIGKGTKWDKVLPSIRSLVLADDTEEDLLLVVDWEQVELWHYAVQFGVKYLLEINESQYYIYGKVYDDMQFKHKCTCGLTPHDPGCLIDKLKSPFFQEGKPKTKKYRAADVDKRDLWDAKAVVLGFLYKLSAEGAAARYGWPLEKGHRMYNWWFGQCPEILKAHEWIEGEMKREKVLRPPPGIKVHYPEPDLSGYNCFGQGPAAVLLWTSMILIDAAFKRQGLGHRIMLSVHDNMIMNIRGARREPERMVEAYETVVKPTLTRPIKWLKNFCFRASAEVCTMWDWEQEDYEDWKERVGLGSNTATSGVR